MVTSNPYLLHQPAFMHMQERARLIEEGLHEMQRVFGGLYAFASMVQPDRENGYLTTYTMQLPHGYTADPEALLHRFDIEWFLQHCELLTDVVFDYVIGE